MARVHVALVCAGLLVVASTARGGHTILVSKGPNGNANSHSDAVSVSGDGSKVLMLTTAKNLVASDTDFQQDAVLVDVVTGALQHVSIEPTGGSITAPTSVSQAVLSADGSTAYFTTSNPADLYAHDVATGTTSLIVDGGASNAGLTLGGCSSAGHRVSFTADLANLDPADPSSDPDVFVYDAVANSVALANTDASGVTLPGPAYLSKISGDGRYVVFMSPAAYVPGDPAGDDVFRKDLLTGAIVKVHPPRSGVGKYVVPRDISDDGNHVLFNSNDPTFAAGDTNGDSDIFLWDAGTGSTELVSKDAAGVVGNGGSLAATMSGDANWIVMRTLATNFVPGDPAHLVRIILKDRSGNRFHSCALSNVGAAPNSTGFMDPVVSDDGRSVAFGSEATNLATGDTPAFMDTFVHRVRGFYDLGYGVAGTSGVPVLAGTGTLDVGAPMTVSLSNTVANAPSLFCVSVIETPVFTFGGTFVALPLAVSLVLPTGGAGGWAFGVTTPALPVFNLYMQCLIPDAGAPAGVAMSNAIVGAKY
jgi:hypothetical protein